MKTKTIMLLLLVATMNGMAQGSSVLMAIHAPGWMLPLDREASFPSFNQYLAEHLVYPEMARTNGIEGNVQVEIIVGSCGKVLKVSILKGLGFGCDEAVLKLLNEMPPWSPAYKNGRPATQKINLNLRFKLASV